jgi:hypothetical protein
MQGSSTHLQAGNLKLLYVVPNQPVNFSTETACSAAAQLSCKGSKAAGNLYNRHAS